MTTDKELASWLEKNVPGFVGVLCGDQGGSMKFEPGASYLINLDTSKTGSGTHWTCIRTSSTAKSIALYVDSMGFPPPKSFTDSVRSNGAELLCSDSKNQRLEDTTDESCGGRACLALYRMATAKNDLESFCGDLAR